LTLFLYLSSPSLSLHSGSFCVSLQPLCLWEFNTMHRQSLGSPSSKLHLHGITDAGNTLITDEPPKPHRLSLSPPSTPHKFIHLIPILTLFCFFILYFFSHTPSPSDLDHFTGFKRHHLGTITIIQQCKLKLISLLLSLIYD
jgi:hypothetical protein